MIELQTENQQEYLCENRKIQQHLVDIYRILYLILVKHIIYVIYVYINSLSTHETFTKIDHKAKLKTFKTLQFYRVLPDFKGIKLEMNHSKTKNSLNARKVKKTFTNYL